MISFNKAFILSLVSVALGHFTGVWATKDNILNDCLSHGEFTVLDKTVHCSFGSGSVPLSLPEKPKEP